MKKRWITLITLLSLLLLLALPALARDLPLVYDGAGLLTEEEVSELNEVAEYLSNDYSCEIAIVVVPDTEGYYVEDYAEAVYRQYHYGYGEDQSGVMLLLSMEERDYDLCAYGYGNTAFTDYGKEWIMDSVLPYLGENDWYGGFEEFLYRCGYCLEEARTNKPVDDYSGNYAPSGPVTPGLVIVGVIIGLIVTLIVQGSMKKKMNSAVLATQAGSYQERELQLTGQSDRFVRKDVTRVRRSDDDSRSGGGGSGRGTSVHSSGFSHSSGKF